MRWFGFCVSGASRQAVARSPVSSPAITSRLKKSLIAAERNRDDVARARRRWMREQGGISPPGAEFRTRGRARRVVPISELVFGTLAQKRSSLEPSLGFAAIAGTPRIENGGPFAVDFANGRRDGITLSSGLRPKVFGVQPSSSLVRHNLLGSALALRELVRMVHDPQCGAGRQPRLGSTR